MSGHTPFQPVDRSGTKDSACHPTEVSESASIASSHLGFKVSSSARFVSLVALATGEGHISDDSKVQAGVTGGCSAGTECLFTLQGNVELMETVSGSKEVVARSDVASVIASRLSQLGPLELIVLGRQENGE